MIVTDAAGNDIALVVTQQCTLENKLSFFSREKDPLQVGRWCKYPKGKDIKTHRHNSESERVVKGFNELFYVESGKVIIYLYDAKDKPVEKVYLGPGDLLVQLSGGHGFDVLEDGTTVLEVKNGPYSDKATDKTIIDVSKW
jgi:hypothetical protein